jgi:hypothetical protein
MKNSALVSASALLHHAGISREEGHGIEDFGGAGADDFSG